MDLPFLPLLWQDLAAGMASFLHQRAAWRLAVLLTGALFAKGRRTVTSWLRAAHVGSGFAPFYSFLAALGRRADCPADPALRPPRPGRRRPPQPDPRPDRPALPLRPCLGHPRPRRPAPAVGRHRPAPA